MNAAFACRYGHSACFPEFPVSISLNWGGINSPCNTGSFRKISGLVRDVAGQLERYKNSSSKDFNRDMSLSSDEDDGC